MINNSPFLKFWNFFSHPSCVEQEAEFPLRSFHLKNPRFLNCSFSCHPVGPALNSFITPRDELLLMESWAADAVTKVLLDCGSGQYLLSASLIPVPAEAAEGCDWTESLIVGNLWSRKKKKVIFKKFWSSWCTQNFWSFPSVGHFQHPDPPFQGSTLLSPSSLFNC